MLFCAVPCPSFDALHSYKLSALRQLHFSIGGAMRRRPPSRESSAHEPVTSKKTLVPLFLGENGFRVTFAPYMGQGCSQ